MPNLCLRATLSCLCVFGFALFFHQNIEKTETVHASEILRYDYCLHFARNASQVIHMSDSILAIYGREGWELVSVAASDTEPQKLEGDRAGHVSAVGFLFAFKRPAGTTQLSCKSIQAHLSEMDSRKQ